MISVSKGISYAILSQPRTGSTLLTELLRGRGLGDPDEYLHDAIIKRLWPELCGSSEPFDLHHYIVSLRQLQLTSSGNFGVKVHYSQLQARFNDRAAIRGFIVGFDKVIILTRANKLAQAVSASKADQTGRWQASEPETKVVPRFDPIFIADGIRRFLFQERQIARLDIAASRPTLFITYEDLCDRIGETWERVQDFLGVVPTPTPATIQSRKQRDAQSLEFENRFLKLIRGEPAAD